MLKYDAISTFLKAGSSLFSARRVMTLRVSKPGKNYAERLKKTEEMV